MLLSLAEWQREIQIGAACLVIALGVYLLINRAIPGFWRGSAIAAGAVVVPRGDGPWGGLDAGADLSRHLPDGGDRCRPRGGRHLISGNVGIAVLVALAHTLAMTLSGGAIAGASTIGWA
jgi:hypothetical protein